MPLPILLLIPAGVLAWTLLNHDEETQIRRGREALRALLNRAAKSGGTLTGEDSIIRNAMFVPALGKIDFRWGRFDEETGKGMGISKIIGAQKLKREYYKDTAFNPRFILRIPDIIARGKAVPHGNTRLKITHENAFVFLEKDFHGQPVDKWVFNAFPNVPGKTMPTKKIAQLLKALNKKE